MIDKPLENIEFSDLEELRDNAVAESRTIEYKRELPGEKDLDKKEFLADVSAFANTLGGDLLYGIVQKKKGGAPASIDGVEIADTDAAKQKYESMIATGIQPKIRVDLHTIAVAKGKAVLLIRVAKSWLSPHRVVFGGHDKFYARNSSGKYPLDTQQLRDAFNLSQTAVERMKEFRADRISEISAGHKLPEDLAGAKAILHFIPAEFFNSGFGIDVKSMNIRDVKSLAGATVNFDGIISFNAIRSPSYLQVFRNGIVESVFSLCYRPQEKDMAGMVFARNLRWFFSDSLGFAKSNDIHPPAFVCLSFVGVKGCSLHMRNYPWPEPIDRDVLLIPEALLESYDIKPKKILLPMCNIFCNAGGINEMPDDAKEESE